MTLQTLLKAFPEIDAQIIQLIADRQRVARHVGVMKRHAGIPIRNIAREKQALTRARKNARALGVDTKLAERVMKLLITASRNAQRHD